MQDAPIIVTLQIDVQSHDYFTKLRNEYFPRQINFLEAHLSLFHHLPSHEALIQQVLQDCSKRPSFNIDVISVKNIGNGAAFIIASPELQSMHKSMQQSFQAFLIPQDKQKLWPHITIQNKVDSITAKRTTELLNQDFNPFTTQAIGLIEWYYLSGLWEKKTQYLFG